jgi:hypothetical protein
MQKEMDKQTGKNTLTVNQFINFVDGLINNMRERMTHTQTEFMRER